MALKDLIINNAKISEDILDKVLSENVNLISEGHSVVLTEKANKFPNRERVLFYLCGKEAWKLLEEKEEIMTITSELEKNLGIKGNTLRPILKYLKDHYQVESQKGKYFILPQGIFALQNFLNSPTSKDLGKKNKNTSSKNSSNRKKRGSSITDNIIELRDEGFFDKGRNITSIHEKLIEKGVTSLKLSSLPSYLLPLLRKNILIRSKQNTESGKGKIWIYTKK